MADQNEPKAGTTPIPNVQLPAEMRTLHDLRDLHKRMEEIVLIRRQQTETGKNSKARNQEILQTLKQKNEVLKAKIKEQTLAAEQAQNQKGKRNTEKDLAIKRRKLDDLKSKTATKRSQLNNLQDRVNEASSLTSELSDDHPMMKQIRVLGNRLDKVMIKYNEAVDTKRTYEVLHAKLCDERLGYEKQLQQLERTLRQKNTSMEELMRLSQQAAKAREIATRQLQKAQAEGHPKEISLSADLQFDLNKAQKPVVGPGFAEAPSESSNQADDPRETKLLVAQIEEACGISTLGQIVEKAERHADTYQSLTDLQKNLQAKVLQLLSKRDTLRDMLDGVVVEPEDEATQARKFDQKEKSLIETEKQVEQLQESLTQKQRFKAELEQGISILGQKVGVKDQKATTLPGKLTLIDAKVKELLAQKSKIGQLAGSSASQRSFVSNADENIRVRLPQDGSFSRRPSIYSQVEAEAAAKDDDEGSDSSDDLFKRNKRGRR